jgi:integrase|tara:strand:- start:3770 stop:4324 length:555 start_codon:yes stop_codon:yes gene_type:complete
MFRWAESQGHVTPIHTIGKREKEFHRTRRLALDEEQRLFSVLPQDLQHLVIAALDTGLRRGALLSLTDKHVLNKMFLVPAQHNKQRRSQRVPLTERVQKLVVGKSGTLFAWDRRAWDRGRNAANIDDFRFHDLRREFASRLLENRVPLPTIQRLLGHHSITMTMRYLHTTDMDIAFREAIQTLE